MIQPIPVLWARFMIAILATFHASATFASPHQPSSSSHGRSNPPALLEQHVEQLTSVGVNGEGYFSPDGSKIIFQSYNRKEHAHTQIYIVNLKTKQERRISHHNGDDTCSYFHPTDPNVVLFASTYQEVKEHHQFREYDPEVIAAKKRAAERQAATQPTKKSWTMKRRQQRYQWMYKPYEIYLFNTAGQKIKRLTHAPGYDAEGTYSTDGTKIIFSSRRDGDQELYLMNADGSDQRRLTWRPGNDGGAFISPNGLDVTWRSFDAKGNSQIMVAKLVQGQLTQIRQLTFGQGIHWAPFWHPSGQWILFSSNHETTYQNRRNFDLYLINTQGTCIKKLTNHPAADVLPVFSNDGRWISFTSKRVGNESQIYRMPFVMPQGCVDPKTFYDASRVLRFSGPSEKSSSHPTRSYRNYRKYRHYRNYKQKTGPSSPHPKQHSQPVHHGPTSKPAHGPQHPPVHAPHASQHGATSATSTATDTLLQHPLVQDLAFLSSPFLEGRDAGTRGIHIASRYISYQFKQIGLSPGGDKQTFFQYFSTTLGVKLGTDNQLATTQPNGNRQSWRIHQEFMPFGFSASGKLAGSVVFAGYGITAPGLGYDDYKNLDVKNKIVLLMRYTPFWHQKSPHPWKDRKDLYAEFRYKILNARSHGAIGVLLVDPPAPKGTPVSPLVSLKLSRGLSDAGIPAIHIRSAVAEHLLQGDNTSLHQLWQNIESAKLPHSRILSSQVDLQVSLTKTTAQIRNVIGILPGQDPHLKKEIVVVGAHYDHLGYGSVGAFPGNHGQIHPGADDNASGTAAMIDIARQLIKTKTRRTFVFIAFAGEERGLLGSAHYVQHPPTHSLQQVVSMLNLDMVGHLRNNRLIIQGSATSPVYVSILREASRKRKLAIKLGPSGYGPSDHTSFYAKKIPVLFFFTGAHGRYHRPQDTFDSLHLPGVVKISSFVTETARILDQIKTRPAYVKVDSPLPKRQMRGGMRVYLGTIPDYGSKVEGVKLTGVRKSSPADKAGIKGGDILLQIGRFPIRNLYDMVFALRDSQPNETIKIVVERNGKTLHLSTVLEARSSQHR